MKNLGEWFKPLKREDIEEKIDLNLQKMTLEEFRNNLHEELFIRDRKILEVQHGLILQKIQVQNIKEQLAVVEERIIKENKNG